MNKCKQMNCDSIQAQQTASDFLVCFVLTIKHLPRGIGFSYFYYSDNSDSGTNCDTV